MTALIIEDEKSLAKEIEKFLRQEGYKCTLTGNAHDAYLKLSDNSYDFILMDLGLPDGDGINILKKIRNENNDSSIIILTARSSTDDKIKGLNHGADDYLGKPFSLLELLSRMNAITRRKHNLPKNTVQIDQFEMDIQNRTLKFKNKVIDLTKKEFDILHYLILNKSRIVTRMQITDHIWGEILEDDYYSNYIDVHIKNIRKKLSSYSPINWLKTIRGIGYRLDL